MPRLIKAAKSALDSALQYLRVNDPSGGIDLRSSPTLIKPHRSRICRNWRLDEPGALKTYPGWLAWLTTSLGANRAQGGRRVYLATIAAFTLFAYQGSLYKPSDAGVAGSTVLTGLNASKEFDFPFDRNLVAVCDGANIPKKSTNGTTWTQLGIDAPGSAATLANLAGGSLTSGQQIEVSYSYKDDELGHEGNEGPTATHTPSGGNLSIRCTIPRSTDAQVDTIVVYARNAGAGQGVRRKVGTVANPGSGSATFDITSQNWDTAVEAPTDHTVAPALRFAVPWKNRWWGVDATIGNRIWFTQIFEPQSWPALFFIDIPFERGDKIAAVIAQGDTLVIFGQSSKPYLIIGQTSVDFEVRPAFGAEAGALGFRAVAAIENGILHAAAEGVYIFDGASDRLLSDDIDLGWQDCMASASVADLERIALVYDRPRKFVHVAVPDLYPFGAAGEWILDLHRTRLAGEAAWTSTDRTIGGYIPWDGAEAATGNRGRLFSWSNTIGRIYEECTGTTADGADMVCDYTGATFATGGIVARFIDLYGEYQPASGTLTCEVIVDGKSQGSTSVAIGSDLPKYGTFKYGTAKKYGGGGDRQSFPIVFPIEAEGRTVYAKFKYTGKSTFKLYTYQIGVSPESAPRGLV